MMSFLGRGHRMPPFMTKPIRQVVALGIMCGGLVAVTQSPAFARQLNDWKLLPRAERLTEMYFTNGKDLSLVLPKNRMQTVRFVVHNLEQQTTAYTYDIRARTRDKTQLLHHGTFALAHSRSRTTAHTVTIPRLNDRIAVEVTIRYRGIAFGQDRPSTQSQVINYWVKTSG